MSFLSRPSPTAASAKELWRLAWPFIVSSSCLTLQIVIDRVLLSQDSPESVGAGLSGVVLFMSALAFFQWTANFSTAFVAQYTGAGRPDRVGPIIGQAMWFAVLAGLAFLAVAPFAHDIIAVTGHEAELQDMEARYFRCLCYCALPTLVTAVAGSFFSGLGRSRTNLFINALGPVVNAFWAVVFIKGYFGFDRMGIEGAGWATVIGSSSSAVVGVFLLLRPENRRVYGNGVAWGFDGKLFARLMYFGLPQGLGATMEYLAFGVFLLFIGRLGPIDLAASSIACTLNLLAFMPMLGVGQAVEVLVGQKLGRNEPEEAERSTWTGLRITFAVTLVVFLAYAFAPDVLLLPFAPTSGDLSDKWAAVAERSALLLRFVAVYCLFDALSITISFALRGAGDTRFVMLASLLLGWPIMVAPAWMSYHFGWGLYVAWGFATLYVIVLSLVLVARFLRGRWKTMRVIEASVLTADEAAVALLAERDFHANAAAAARADVAPRRGDGLRRADLSVRPGVAGQDGPGDVVGED